MRIPNDAHLAHPWRIHELTQGFRLEDVWELPGTGAPDGFPALVHAVAAMDPGRSPSQAVRLLFAVRSRLGDLLHLDDVADGTVPTLRDRFPADLRAAPRGPTAEALPFTSLYLLDDEWAVEAVNRTVHGVLHLSWVPDGSGSYRGRLAVYVRPNGLLGSAYMALIKPFRHLVVYPSMLRQLGRATSAPAGTPA